MTQYTSFSHHYLATTPSPSTYIKEHFLVSTIELDRLDESLNLLEKDAQRAPKPDFLERLQNVSNVYNDNVKYINDELNKPKRRAFPDFTTWQRDFPSFKTDKAGEYSDEKCIYEKNGFNKMEELCQLEQLTQVCDSFYKRINALSKRIATLNQPVERIPNFTPIVLLKAQTNFSMFELELRTKATVPTASTASLQSSSAQAAIVSDSRAQLTPVAVAPSASSSSSKEITPSFNATIACNVGEGSVLGICCDTLEWGKNPIAFTATEKGWVGQIPTNVDYKIVVLKDGKILKWEQGYNRKLPENSPPLTLASNQIKF